MNFSWSWETFEIKEFGIFNDSTLLGRYTSAGKNGTYLECTSDLKKGDQCTLKTYSNTDILS